MHLAQVRVDEEEDCASIDKPIDLYASVLFGIGELGNLQNALRCARFARRPQRSGRRFAAPSSAQFAESVK
jgi:hypothetical protein